MENTIQPETGSNKKIWIIGGVVVALVIVGAMMYRGSNDQTAQQGIVVGNQNALTINDQDPNSVAVLVSDASLRAAGFVAIFDGSTGQPANLLGASGLLTSGSHKNVSIIMNIKAGATYFAELFSDDGNGNFDQTNDRPLTDNSGKPVIQMFKVRLSSNPNDIKG